MLNWLQIFQFMVLIYTSDFVDAQGKVFKLTRPIKLPFRSYLDVHPSRIIVPAGYSKVLWTFSAHKNQAVCEDNRVEIYMQPGGLPFFENVTNLPSDFFVVNSNPLLFRLYTNSMPKLIVDHNPIAGPWYVIALIRKDELKIQHKGMSAHCIYSYLTSMEPVLPFSYTDIKTGDNFTLMLENTSSINIRFNVKPFTSKFKFKVISCEPSDCNLTISYYFKSISCYNLSEECYFVHHSPRLQQDHAISIHSGTIGFWKVTVQVIEKGCVPNASRDKDKTCVYFNFMDRVMPFDFNSVIFGELKAIGLFTSYILHPKLAIDIPFELHENQDVGGTLNMTLVIFNDTQSIKSALPSNFNLNLCVAVFHDHLPNVSWFMEMCTFRTERSGFLHWRPDSLQTTSSLLIPYPLKGIYHVLIQPLCYNIRSRSECLPTLSATVLVNITPCARYCDLRGTCSENKDSSDVQYSVCKCDAKYRGHACSDASHALSGMEQLEEILLLTLSNLAFIPTIVLAYRHKYFVEAFVYTYTMFFSTFYHACDGNRLPKYKYCLMRFGVLQTSDFFGSVSSLWLTVILMAKIRIRWLPPVLQIVGPFAILIGVSYDKTNVYVFVVPWLSGFFIIMVSWGYKMYQRKQIYPSCHRYVYFLLPGMTLAGIAGVIFTFLITENNYKYTHSAWHVCIATSVIFLLPPGQRKYPIEAFSSAVLRPNALSSFTDQNDGLSEEEQETADEVTAPTDQIDSSILCQIRTDGSPV